MKIKYFIAFILIKLLAKLPLCQIRQLGSLIGLISLKFSKRSAQRLRHNLLVTGLANDDTIEVMIKKTAMAQGMTLMESVLIAWQKNPQYINSLFEPDEASFTQVRTILNSGKNIFFLTPHIGNFELALKYGVYNLPINIQILYKLTKNDWLNQIMFNGRYEDQDRVQPQVISRKGVSSLIKHLQNGGDIGILPDNVASQGSGEWVKFFGQDVYATSLTAKIYQQYQPITVIMQSIRTKNGFKMKFIPFEPQQSSTQGIMQELYYIIEQLVRETPEQYYWSYDRFRQVAHAKSKPI